MGDFMGISRDVDNLYMMVSSYLYLRSWCIQIDD